MTKREQQIHQRLQPICASLPGSLETVSFGHPTWRVRDKTYCILETYQGKTSLCVKVGKPLQSVFLADPRFYRTPYIGQHGWVSLIVDSPPDWDEVRELVRSSYDLVQTKLKTKPKPRV